MHVMQKRIFEPSLGLDNSYLHTSLLQPLLLSCPENGSLQSHCTICGSLCTTPPGTFPTLMGQNSLYIISHLFSRHEAKTGFMLCVLLLPGIDRGHGEFSFKTIIFKKFSVFRISSVNEFQSFSFSKKSFHSSTRDSSSSCNLF